MTSIVVVGSVNLDLTASVSRLPAPGETVTGAELSRFPGGKGANQALAARRLGADVQLIARTGNDATADEALVLLRDGGVDLSGCERDNDIPTGIALICVAPSGENHIVVAPGANGALLPDSLRLSAADALICQLEVPESTIALAASQFRGFFCANLAPAKRIDVTILQRADLVVVNETESSWYGDTLAACTGLVATTYGADGASLSQNGVTVAKASAPVIRAIDTTGAGDTFTAALTLALVEGMQPDDALEFACAAGAAAATKMGAQPSLPTRAEVLALLGVD